MRPRLVAAALAMAVLGAQAAPPSPDVRAVQAAYDEARNEPDSNRAHVDDLKITSASCSPLKRAEESACQISFLRQSEPQGRLYFEVVTLEARQGQWVLTSGLCRSRPAKRQAGD